MREILMQIYFWVAIAASAILVFQLVMSLLGLSDDGGADFDGDMSDGIDGFGDGFNLFTFRGVVAFFTVASWSGYLLLLTETKEWLAITLSLVLGLVALVLVAVLLQQMLKLQASGNIDIDQAIGKTATVYLTVPQSPEKSGKVNVLLQDRHTEFEAKTHCSRDIRTGEQVKIIGVDGNILIVEPLN